jgi:beta-lactam-binding protein with PASTA domain
VGSDIRLTVAVPQKTAIVPDLSGMTVDEAIAALDAVGLDLGTKTEVQSDEFEPGQISDQDPAPDEEVNLPASVNVDVVGGPATLTLPDVTCIPYSQAKAHLNDLGFTKVVLGGTVEARPECPASINVAEQDPPAGQYSPETLITLFQGTEPPSPSPSPESPSAGG